MLRILPDAKPPRSAAAGESALCVRLDMARGERASFQLLIRPSPGNALRNVGVEPSDLIHSGSRDRIAATHVEWHQVGFVKVTEILHPHKWGARSLAPGWCPDPLLPVDRFEVRADFTQPVWITVRTPPEATPGEYTGRILVRMDGDEPVPVNLAIAVHDVTLALGAGHIRTSFDLLDGFLEQVYGKPLSRKMARRYGEFALEHRLNPDDFSRNDPPELDDLRHYLRLGMNSFCVINMASHRGESIRGGLNSPPEWYTKEHWQEMEQRVAPFLFELKKEPALWKMAYVHGFDERDIDTHGEAMRLFFGNVRTRWGLPTLTTSHIPTDPAVMRDLQVDWLGPIWAQ